MAEIDEAAVEKRAKALAEADGYSWDFELRPWKPGTKIETQLSPEKKREYLDRARAELRNA
jgi:hypothetical protein